MTSLISLGTYGEKVDPKVSPFARSSEMTNAEFTTGEVVGAFVAETFRGEGSLVQDLRARNVTQEEATGTPLSEDDWKAGEFYREGLNYYPTITKESAKILAETEDERRNRQFIMGQATGGQTAVGFGASLVTGLVEPKNFAAGVAVGVATAGAGFVVPSLGRALAVTSVRQAAGRGAAEGVVGTALLEPSNMESSRIVQGDYTLVDSLVNLGLGSILGAGFSAGGKALELRGREKRFEAIKELRGKRDEVINARNAEAKIAIQELDTAISQLSQGRQVDVSAVRALSDAERIKSVTKTLDTVNKKIEEIQPDVARLPEIERAAELEKKADDLALQADQTDALIRQQEDLRKKATEIREKARLDELEVSEQLETLYNKKRKANDTLIEDGDYVKTPYGDAKVLSRSEKSFQVETTDGTRVDVDKAQVNAINQKKPDTTPVKKLQEDTAKPDNSSVYSKADSDYINKYLDENGFEDEIALEKDLEFMQEQIAELREQGLLNDAELDVLARLDEVDAESAIFDNVLLNAKVCLTRG